jgi:hypothetical protein
VKDLRLPAALVRLIFWSWLPLRLMFLAGA